MIKVIINSSLFLTFLLLSSCKKVELGQKVNYVTIKRNDTSFSTRKRFTAFIKSPSANSFDERGRVVMQAAYDLHNETGCDFCSVFLELTNELSGQGSNWAYADYSPDEKGISGDQPTPMWKVQVSRLPYPSDKELQILIANNKRDKNLSDTENFEIISNSFKISTEKVDRIISKYLFLEKEGYRDYQE